MSNRNAQLRRLFDYICVLHLHWHTYNDLFGHSEDRIKNLSRRTGRVFGVFQSTLLENVLVDIAKLLDKAKVCGKETLTFARILDDVPPGSRTKLTDDLRALQQQCEPIIAHRHRRLAHNDIAIAMDKEALPGVSRQMIREAVGGIAKLYDAVAVTLGESPAVFDVIKHDTAVETIMKVLQTGNDKLDAEDFARRSEFN